MSESEHFPDEVPVADAVEQARPAVPSAELESVDPDERVPLDDGSESPPLESDESDWREQHQIVEDPEDEFR